MKTISRASGLVAAALLAACGSSDGGGDSLGADGLPRALRP